MRFRLTAEFEFLGSGRGNISTVSILIQILYTFETFFKIQIKLSWYFTQSK